MENDIKDIAIPERHNDIDEPFFELVPEQVSAIAAKVMELYSGPLPPPLFLADYEKALPGTADRIISVFEDNAKHNREMERIAFEASIAYAKIGQKRGFALSVIGIIAGVIIALSGVFLKSNPATISAIFTGSTVSGFSIHRLVSKFIDGPSTDERKNGSENDITSL